MANMEEMRIKEEPLDEDDEDENLHGNVNLGGAEQLQDFVTKHFFQTTNVKYDNNNDDEEEDDDEDPDKLQIVDEQADVITVQASDFKTRQGRDFIQQLNLTSQLKKSCNKCGNSFDNPEDYQRHSLNGGLCGIQQIYPCAKFCGCYFTTIEERRVHEKQAHKTTARFNNKIAPTIKANTTNTVRYKLKSQYLKRLSPNREELTPALKNDDNIALQISKRIKEEPTTPPPTNDAVPLTADVVIKEEPRDFEEAPADLTYPEVKVKSEPIDIMDTETIVPNNNNIIINYNIKEEIDDGNYDNKINSQPLLQQLVPGIPMQLPPNLKVIPLPMTATQKFANMSINQMPNTNNNNNNNSCIIKNAQNGLFTLPKNVKIVKLNGPQNLLKFSTPLTISTTAKTTESSTMSSLSILPRNISNQMQFNNSNNNNSNMNNNINNNINNNNNSNVPSVIVKLENLLPKNTKLMPLTKVVLKPTNTNINNISTYINNNNSNESSIIKPFNFLKINNNIKIENTTTTTTTATAQPVPRRIQVESKAKLRRIEAEPQKRKLIIDMLQQIKHAEECSGMLSSIVESSCSEFSQDDSVDTNSQFNINNNSNLSINNNYNNKQQQQIQIPKSLDNALTTLPAQLTTTTLPAQLTTTTLTAPLKTTTPPPPTTTTTINEIKVENLSGDEIGEASNGSDDSEPSSLYVPLNARTDPVMIKLAKQNPNYRYCLICPLCPFYFELKCALRKHIVKVHNMPKEELQELIVESKPFRINANVDKTSISLQSGEDTQADQQDNSIGKRKKKNYECARCARVFSSIGVLNDHLRANCSRDPQYPCPSCSKRFYSQSTLNCHLTIHTGELPHKCNFCDKRFRTRGQVTVHHRTHTGERPFVCQICNQAFTHRETLIAHLSRHIGMKRYKCYGCNKHFSCISGLKTHRDKRPDTCLKVKFCSRAVGPRVRVIRGNVLFEPQPEINPYLRTDDPPEVLSEIQNQPPQEV